MSTMALAAHRPSPLPAARGRMLVADDQPAVREALRLLLKPHGYEVRTVASPAADWRRSASASTCWLMDLNYARDTTTGREGLELVSARARGGPVRCRSW